MMRIPAVGTPQMRPLCPTCRHTQFPIGHQHTPQLYPPVQFVHQSVVDYRVHILDSELEREGERVSRYPFIIYLQQALYHTHVTIISFAGMLAVWE